MRRRVVRAGPALPAFALAAAAAVAVASPLGGQACDEEHYRWTEKTATALAVETAKRVFSTTILTRWPLPGLTSEARFKCTDRGAARTRSTA